MLDNMSNDKIEALKAELLQNPNSSPNPRSFYLLAKEYIALGMSDEAESVCKQGLQRYPEYLCANILLGKIYMARKLNKEAIKEFERVVNIMPSNLFVYKKLTELYYAIGEKDKAVEIYIKILSMGKDNLTYPVFLPKSKVIPDVSLLSKAKEIDDNKHIQEVASNDRPFKAFDDMESQIKPKDFEETSVYIEEPVFIEELFVFNIQSFNTAIDENLYDDNILTVVDNTDEDMIVKPSFIDIGLRTQSMDTGYENNETKLKKLDSMLLRFKKRQQEVLYQNAII
jgi:tetratricopeptide (TPR) repeat protein